MKTGSTAIQLHIVARSAEGPFQQLLVHLDRVDVPFSPVVGTGRTTRSTLKKGYTAGHHTRMQAGIAGVASEGAMRADMRREWSNFLSQLRDAAAHWRNVLISSEFFSFGSVRGELVLAALRPSYSVRIVVVYRRFFEWITSYYNQRYKVEHRGTAGTRRQPSLRLCADGRHLTLHEFLSEWSLHNDAHGLSPFGAYVHWAHVLLRNDAGSGSTARISVLNMHDDARGPLLTRFICEHTGAAHTCAWLREKRPGQLLAAKTRTNPGLPFTLTALADIVVGRAKAGLVAADDPRWDKPLSVAVHAAEAWHKRAGIQPPHACIPTAELRWVWRRSMSDEAFLLPDWHDVRRLRTAFEAKLPGPRHGNSTHFCYGDAAATFGRVGASETGGGKLYGDGDGEAGGASGYHDHRRQFGDAPGDVLDLNHMNALWMKAKLIHEHTSIPGAAKNGSMRMILSLPTLLMASWLFADASRY